MLPKLSKPFFNMRMQGISASAIADKLNATNVPSPAEHKKETGSNFSANLQKAARGKMVGKGCYPYT